MYQKITLKFRNKLVVLPSFEHFGLTRFFGNFFLNSNITVNFNRNEVFAHIKRGLLHFYILKMMQLLIHVNFGFSKKTLCNAVMLKK